MSADAGYAANYYRFFGATEAPFDWYQSVLAQAAISTAGVWMRLPARRQPSHLVDHQPLRAGPVGPWKKGPGEQPGRRMDRGAVFLAAAAVQQRLRPEALIAFGALAAWMLVENAIATRRLWPAAPRSWWRSSA